MEITKKVDGNTTMISLKGRLDTITSGQLESEMKNVLQEGLSNLVFDFSELDYISSSGLRVMLTTQKKADEIEAK
ncbi:MAG: anti-sigma factor antagonist, partial [Candidatus Moranbacteria bacterium]|nr:anti-sigma factor antagonist [Candidatus Moranbacteria bacterium]